MNSRSPLFNAILTRLKTLEIKELVIGASQEIINLDTINDDVALEDLFNKNLDAAKTISKILIQKLNDHNLTKNSDTTTEQEQDDILLLSAEVVFSHGWIAKKENKDDAALKEEAKPIYESLLKACLVYDLGQRDPEWLVDCIEEFSVEFDGNIASIRDQQGE